MRVRGTCVAGHVTETTSDPGRVTWHGPCATKGCTHQVYAKRVPADVRPPTDDAAVVPPPADDDDAVREVSWNVPQPKHGTGDVKLPDERPGEPGERPDVQPVPAADPELPALVVVDDRTDESEPAGGRGDGRLVKPGRRERDHRDVRVWRHPLDW